MKTLFVDWGFHECARNVSDRNLPRVDSLLKASEDERKMVCGVKGRYKLCVVSVDDSLSMEISHSHGIKRDPLSAGSI